MNPLGKHGILECYGCKFEVLNDEQLFLDAFKKAVKEARMTLLNLSSHKFEPQGLTALALLSESHMSVHTYPELGYAAIDVFTCGDEGSPEKAVEVLLSILKPTRHDVKFLPRGNDIREEDKNA